MTHRFAHKHFPTKRISMLSMTPVSDYFFTYINTLTAVIVALLQEEQLKACAQLLSVKSETTNQARYISCSPGLRPEIELQHLKQ